VRSDSTELTMTNNILQITRSALTKLFDLSLNWFVWRIRRFSLSYDRLILKTDGHIFCLLFNIKAMIRRKDARFNFNPAKKIYWAKSASYQLYFYSKEHAQFAYNDGIKTRALGLGNDYLLPQINFKDGDVVVDCGANVGDLNLYFKENKIKIEYIGIEPSPLEYECLSINVNPSETHNIGLWNDDGLLRFYVSSKCGDSSFIAPPSYDDIIKIPAKRLDSFFDKKIKLLKIEAEGAEPEALMGCEKIFHKIEYISADLGPERGIDQTTTLVTVINLLLAKNFEFIDIYYDRLVALFRNKDLH